MEGREDRTKKKRDHILQTATRLFATHGFKRVSLEEIASEAAVSRVTIYKYFENKEGLIESIIEKTLRDQIGSFQLLLSSPLPFQEKLTILMEQKFQLARSFSREFLEQFLDWQMTPGFQSINDELKLTKLEFMEQGKNEGAIRAELDLETILVYIETFQEGLLSRKDSIQSLGEKQFKELIHVFFHGFCQSPVEK